MNRVLITNHSKAPQVFIQKSDGSALVVPPGRSRYISGDDWDRCASLEETAALLAAGKEGGIVALDERPKEPTNEPTNETLDFAGELESDEE